MRSVDSDEPISESGADEAPAATSLREGSGFHPPAVIALACAFLGAAALVAVIGTPVLKLPGRSGLSPTAHGAKLLLATVLGSVGAGLFALRPQALAMARVFVAIGGVLVPLGLLLGVDQTPVYKYIDWEFLWSLEALVATTGAIALAYLMRPSVAYAFEHGGVPVEHEGYYCAACNAPFEVGKDAGCPYCEGPVFALYRSPGGVAYAREL